MLTQHIGQRKVYKKFRNVLLGLSLQKQFMHIPYEQDIKRTFSYFITGL